MAETQAYARDRFADAAQQRDTATLGMWVFIATEVMFFGGLFTAYAAYHHIYKEAFESAARHTDFWLGTINTAVLLLSSMCMALGVHAAKKGDRGALTRYLLLTLLLGAVFLGLKGVEYAEHIYDHLLPGAAFQYEARYQEGAGIFFFLYFVMTGLHAFHMLIGISLLAVLAVLTRRGKFSAAYHTPVELAGLYWHFVDVVWIFLFPMFYLAGGH